MTPGPWLMCCGGLLPTVQQQDEYRWVLGLRGCGGLIPTGSTTVGHSACRRAWWLWGSTSGPTTKRTCRRIRMRWLWGSTSDGPTTLQRGMRDDAAWL